MSKSKIPNLNISLIGIASVVAVGGVGYLLYKTSSAVEEVFTEDLNPASNQNIIYNGIIGGIGRTISGEENWSLGSWLYDVMNDDPNMISYENEQARS